MDMTLNSILSILGSLASVAAIPLSVYLYLRSKEARVARVRRDVVKTLSYQIGEGRNLNLFTIVTVIRSRVRDEGVREDSISVEQIVEDLVSETITEPMLDPTRKDRILDNLAKLYSLGAISRFLERYPITVRQIARWASQEYPLSEEDKELADERADVLESTEGLRLHKAPSISTFFGVIAIVASSILFAAYERELAGIFDSINRKMPFPEFLIGTASSLVATIITFFVYMVLGRGRRLLKRTKGKAGDLGRPPNSVG
jgi:hypothetical protein